MWFNLVKVITGKFNIFIVVYFYGSFQKLLGTTVFRRSLICAWKFTIFVLFHFSFDYEMKMEIAAIQNITKIYLQKTKPYFSY